MDRKRNDKGFSSWTIEGLIMTENNVCEKIIIAGFGGQGIILAGKLLAQTAMRANKEVTFMPSYGAEVRGGTANCMVSISNEKIACPVINKPDSLIVMNKASLNKFASRLKEGGLLIMNSSLIHTKPQLDKSIEIISVPADQIAVELGNQKAANMVMLGAYLGKRPYLTIDAAAKALPEVLASRYHSTLPLNIKALHKGGEFTLKSEHILCGS